MKFLTIRGVVFVLSVSLNMCALNAKAQESEPEARYLVSIANEIENLKSLTEKAEATADKDQRVQFDYAALKNDLDEMQRAIEKHVKEPSRSPRVVGALNTTYSKVTKDE
jgi:RAQPRD family integrative conjugative element protein